MSAVSSVLRRRVLGVAFLLLVAALLLSSVLVYQKAFVPVTEVTLRADNSGTQLLRGGDVKVRGVIVGEVREISTDGRQASLRLALDPDRAESIPANVTARLTPKTLFGEKFVDLQVPEQPAPRPLRDGDVIGMDRSAEAVELERVLDDVLPLLRAVDPAKLNATLTAIATALSGNGERLGANLERLGAYLEELNAEMPTIKADVKQLATVLTTYADAAPDLLAILRDAAVTTSTVTEQRAQLDALLTSTTQFADYTTGFLIEHEDRLIQLADVSRPTLEVLARYSPEFPCLFRGLTDIQPRLEESFGGRQNALHITLELGRDQGKYERGRDEPRYASKKGPHCAGLPHPPVPYPGNQFANGYDYGSPRTSLPLVPPAGVPHPSGGAGTDVTMGLAGTPAEQAFVAILLAPVLQQPADEVPDVATLLFGPMLRGTAVSYT
ncbi:MAG TPA: MCE family protein [Cryptosporangiaceae bacterium]|nr:MCE family protein [Cryptosporangiaceae bacterium]